MAEPVPPLLISVSLVVYQSWTERLQTPYMYTCTTCVRLVPTGGMLNKHYTCQIQPSHHRNPSYTPACTRYRGNKGLLDIPCTSWYLHPSTSLPRRYHGDQSMLMSSVWMMMVGVMRSNVAWYNTVWLLADTLCLCLCVCVCLHVSNHSRSIPPPPPHTHPTHTYT